MSPENYTQAVRTELSAFPAISLAESESAGLGERFDTKFIFPYDLLTEILKEVSGNYSVLEIDQNRLFHYESLYFDTDNLATYFLHHNGRGFRHKVRLRTYVDSGISYLEVKKKENTGKIIKLRKLVDSASVPNPEEVDGFLVNEAGIDSARLEETLRIRYMRFTLVSNTSQERVTFDLFTEMENVREGESYGLPSLIIAEVKQGSFKRKSPMMEVMRKHHIRPINISKYCLGVASCYKGVRNNTFKLKLRMIQKMQEKLLAS